MSTLLNDMTPEEISELLLDYSKGRLNDAEMRSVQQAAAASDEIAAELALYEGLSRAGAGQDHDDAAPGEMGWARLARSIDAYEAAGTLPVAANDNSGRFWRYATFALGFIVLGQVGFQLMGADKNTANDKPFVPVTEPVADFALQIVFQPNASEAAIRDLLLQNKAQIVSGPSSIGIYEISFDSEDSRSAGLERLEQATEIIESATRLD